MNALFVRSLSNRLGQFSHFFGQPGNGRRNPALEITLTKSAVDDRLEFGEIHVVTVGEVQPRVDVTQASRDSSPF